MKTILCTVLMACIFQSAGTQNYHGSEYYIYYPADDYGKIDKSELALYYYPNIDGNRPYANFSFTDGTKFDLTCVCGGEYDWCIRNSSNIDIAYLKIEPDSEGEAIFLDVKYNENSSDYYKYLNKMEGTFRTE